MHADAQPEVSVHADGEHPRELLAVPDVARVLGGISRRQVYLLLERGQLQSVWIGRRRLIPANSVTAYVAHLHAEARERTP